MAEQEHSTTQDSARLGVSRRGVVTVGCAAAMGVGLAASYGTFFGYAGRYLYPARPQRKGWMYVAIADQLRVGDAVTYQTPAGSPVTIARHGDSGAVEDFIALSSTCPHLGCHVHWEAVNNRFFCPCHNGAFNPQGKAISGPPGDAGQSLPRYALKLENGMLFIEVELESVASADDATCPHDSSEVC